jgi:hypothetical protein
MPLQKFQNIPHVTETRRRLGSYSAQDAAASLKVLQLDL